MRPRWILIAMVFSLGCACGSRPNTSHRVERVDDVVVEVSSSDSVGIRVVPPSGRDPKDGKFHYQVFVHTPNRKSGSRTEPTKVHYPPAGSTQTLRTEPERPKKPELKSWAEHYGRLTDEADYVVDVSKPYLTSSVDDAIEGVCSIDNRVSCWDVRGRPSPGLTRRVSEWKDRHPFPTIADRQLNTLIAVRDFPAVGWSYGSSFLPFDWRRYEYQGDRDLHYFMFGIDAPIYEMPFYLMRYTAKAESAFYPFPKSGSVKIHDYEVEHSRENYRSMAGDFAAIFKVTPGLRESDSIECVWDDGSVSASSGDHHTQLVAIHHAMRRQSPRERIDPQKVMTNSPPAKFRILYGKMDKVLWKYLPLRPVVEATNSDRNPG